MKNKRRLWLFGSLAIGAITILTLLAAPANNKLNSGSTYNRAPDGYGAWYTFMSQRGTPVERWRKPFEDLATNKNTKTPTTLLRVNSDFKSKGFSLKEENWVKLGNTIVILGRKEPVTNAPFSTQHKTEIGIVKIDTKRRNKVSLTKGLRDNFGAIIWQDKIGKGSYIYCLTPHLAANAYQDYPGNYELLAQIVTENSQSIFVDEYSHGHKDSEAINREQKQDIFSYFAQTPLFPALIQITILLIVAILASNHRFGKPLTVLTPVIDNSQAYIQALAGVLQKAETSDFILETLGKEEQLQLQKELFLGETLLEPQIVIDAWVQKTGRPPRELSQLLQTATKKSRLSETELLHWLTKWQQIHHQITLNKIDF
jgi:Domain of unknown function (DUF4350)